MKNYIIFPRSCQNLNNRKRKMLRSSKSLFHLQPNFTKISKNVILLNQSDTGIGI